MYTNTSVTDIDGPP